MSAEQERYEITVLIGPCSREDAEWLNNRIAHYIYDDTCLGHPLGAVVAMGPFQETGQETGEH